MKTLSQDLIQWILDEDLNRDFYGAEQGFNERADVVRAADGTDLNAFWNEINATIAIRNQDKSDIISTFSTPITQGPVTEVAVPTEVDFERATEYGQPVGIRGAATKLYRGFDFEFYDLGVRYTWMSIAEMDLGQLRMHHNLALEAELKLRFRKVMERLFNPLNSTGFLDNNEPITVFAAYNGDGEVPPVYKHNSFDGQHNHYTTTGAATVRPQDLDALATQTEEHGYTLQNGYTNVLWVNKQEADKIKAFRVADGASFDFVIDSDQYNGRVWVPNNGQYVGGPQGRVKGQIGTYGPFHVVEEGYIPAGYLVSVVSGGQQNLGNPIGIREHTNPAYRGLKVLPGERADYPLLNSFYRRGLGTGVRHRGGIAIKQVTTAGTYAVPAAYDRTAA